MVHQAHTLVRMANLRDRDEREYIFMLDNFLHYLTESHALCLDLLTYSLLNTSLERLPFLF